MRRVYSSDTETIREERDGVQDAQWVDVYSDGDSGGRCVCRVARRNMACPRCMGINVTRIRTVRARQVECHSKEGVMTKYTAAALTMLPILAWFAIVLAIEWRRKR